MLQIDLKPSKLNKRVLTSSDQRQTQMTMNTTTQSISNGLNSYNSLNRAVRIKDMARIVEDNKIMLRKL